MLEISKSSESNLIDVAEFNKRFQEFAENHGTFVQELTNLSVENKISWGSILEENALKYADKTAIKFEDTNLTYQVFNEKVNQYANYFISLG